ncbi:hypothetical protein NL676_025472 [Syzygium grande]|nr:hypothetical protein NL676_025472 [Syzygium grande]
MWIRKTKGKIFDAIRRGRQNRRLAEGITGICVKLCSWHLLFLDLSGYEATGSDAAQDDAKWATPAPSNARLRAYSYNAS